MLDDVQLKDRRPARLEHHRPRGRPPFERIALLLQGGGALGAYQAGVYQGLAEAGLHPDWTAGISIGASTRPSLPVIRLSSESRSCGNSGKSSPRLILNGSFRAYPRADRATATEVLRHCCQNSTTQRCSRAMPLASCSTSGARAEPCPWARQASSRRAR